MVLNFSNSEPGESRRLRVGVLLFNDVEVLDFAGPLEVFGVAITASGEPAYSALTSEKRSFFSKPFPAVASCLNE